MSQGTLAVPGRGSLAVPGVPALAVPGVRVRDLVCELFVNSSRIGVRVTKREQPSCSHNQPVRELSFALTGGFFYVLAAEEAPVFWRYF